MLCFRYFSGLAASAVAQLLQALLLALFAANKTSKKKPHKENLLGTCIVVS
jgi:hypothetical protein